jgi:hypothetical protein
MAGDSTDRIEVASTCESSTRIRRKSHEPSRGGKPSLAGHMDLQLAVAEGLISYVDPAPEARATDPSESCAAGVIRTLMPVTLQLDKTRSPVNTCMRKL